MKPEVMEIYENYNYNWAKRQLSQYLMFVSSKAAVSEIFRASWYNIRERMLVFSHSAISMMVCVSVYHSQSDAFARGKLRRANREFHRFPAVLGPVNPFHLGDSAENWCLRVCV